MNPLRSLRRFWTSPVRHTDEATALFSRFAKRHGLHHLEIDAPVEVLWEFPIQKGLSLPLTLGLQNNDELNFGVPGFWSSFFPFPRVAEQFESCLDAWLTGGARIVRQRRFARIASSSILEVRKGGDWKTVYRAFGGDWPHDADVIQIRPTTHRMSRSVDITYQNVSPLPILLFRIGIHQRADHALVGNAALSRGALEKRHRALR